MSLSVSYRPLPIIDIAPVPDTGDDDLPPLRVYHESNAVIPYPGLEAFLSPKLPLDITKRVVSNSSSLCSIRDMTSGERARS